MASCWLYRGYSACKSLSPHRLLVIPFSVLVSHTSVSTLYYTLYPDFVSFTFLYNCANDIYKTGILWWSEALNPKLENMLMLFYLCSLKLETSLYVFHLAHRSFNGWFTCFYSLRLNLLTNHVARFCIATRKHLFRFKMRVH